MLQKRQKAEINGRRKKDQGRYDKGFTEAQQSVVGSPIIVRWVRQKTLQSLRKDYTPPLSLGYFPRVGVVLEAVMEVAMVGCCDSAYEAPQVESVLVKEDIELEVYYAGNVSGL